MCFSPDTRSFRMPGRHLDQTFLSNPLRVDELLRWHFRQAVLTNMKGAGELWLDTELECTEDAVNGVTGQYTSTTGATGQCATAGVPRHPEGHSENLVLAV